MSDYACHHCGQRSSMMGHYAERTPDMEARYPRMDPICSNTLHREPNGNVTGFACPAGHVCSSRRQTVRGWTCNLCGWDGTLCKCHRPAPTTTASTDAPAGGRGIRFRDDE